LGLVAVWFVVAATASLVLGSCQVLALQGGVVVAVTVAAAVAVPSAGGGVETVAAVVAVVMFGVVAVAPTAKLLRSCTVLQAAIYVSDGIEMVVEVAAWLWLMVTALALGPVPIRQAIEKSGGKHFLPNLVHL
jgi:hypothetical protein